MSGSRIAAKVAKGIAKAAALTGNGQPLAGTIVRPGAVDKTTYPYSNAEDEDFPCILFLGLYSARDRDGTNIAASDLRAMVGASAGTDPRNGDKMEIDGKRYDIVSVSTYKPGGVVLYWTCQLRAAS